MRDNVDSLQVGLLPSVGLMVLIATGCLDNPGVEPPERELNFPIAMALSNAPSSHLFVANGNSDLRYNAGSVQSFSLDALATCLSETCVGPDPNTPLLSASECTLGLDEAAALPCAGLFVDEVLIGSYADGLTLGPSGQRLYLPVRSDGALSFVDVAADGTLSCGGARLCDAEHRTAISTLETPDGEALPTDPVDVFVGSFETDFGAPAGSGDYVVLAHRAGAVSLLRDPGDASAAPRLIDVLTGLSDNLEVIRRDPLRGELWSASSTATSIQRIGIAIDASATLDEAFAYSAGRVSLGDLDFGAGGGGARDVVFDPRPGVDRAYVLSRPPGAPGAPGAPEALVSLEGASLARGWVVEVGNGPSRLAVSEHASVGRTMAYASCYNSRSIYVVDVDLGITLAVVRGMSGPFELAVDDSRGWLLVLDYRASVVRVFDLNPMFACLSGVATSGCSPVQLGMIGIPRPVEELR